MNTEFINNVIKLDRIVKRDDTLKYCRDGIAYCKHILELSESNPELARHYYQECKGILDNIKRELKGLN